MFKCCIEEFHASECRTDGKHSPKDFVSVNSTFSHNLSIIKLIAVCLCAEVD